MYDLCGQTNVAFTIAQTKRLHPGWEAFKRDCVTDKTKQWMYISPEKVEYFALGGLEATVKTNMSDTISHKVGLLRNKTS